MRKEKLFPVTVSARVTELEKNLIEEIAWKKRLTKSQFVRQVLTTNLNQFVS